MLFLFLSCTSSQNTPTQFDTEYIQDLAIYPSERIPSVLVVTFESVEPGDSHVVFGYEGETQYATPIQRNQSSHRAYLVGMNPSSDIELKIVLETEEGRYESPTVTAQNGALPFDSYAFEVTINNYSAPPDTTLLMSVFGEPCHLVMASMNGRVFWSMEQGDEEYAGLDVMFHRNEILYNTLHVQSQQMNYNPMAENNQIHRVDLAGYPLEEYTTPLAHHFFTLGPNEELVWLATETESVNNIDIKGDAVIQQELSGTEVLLSLFDIFTPPYLTDDIEFIDWTHANGLTWDARRESYTLSAANTNKIVEFSAEGTPLRIIGRDAEEGEYGFFNFNHAFRFPHGVHWTQNGELLVFSTVQNTSQAIRYAIDEDEKKLTQVWSFGADYGYRAHVLGSVQELSDGNILINWGSVGMLQIVSPEGTVLWEARTALQRFINDVQFLPRPYDLAEEEPDE
ncbi:MAG: aryl-sulfate sulfotransferase [Myxococcota bacterium]|nr:aryl-sulfate sulfotransferase [Myxococcota bacterium]